MPLEFDLILADGTADELTLEGFPANPESCYLLQDVVGLESRELRGSEEPVADGDGTYLGPQAREGIVLGVEGIIYAADRAERGQRGRDLGALLRGGVNASPFVVRIVGRDGYPEDLIATMRPAQRLVAARSGGAAGSSRLQPFQFGLRSAAAVWEGAALRSLEVPVADSIDGLTFPWVFPISFGASVAGGSPAVNDGDDLAWPTIRVYGPCSGLVLENLSTAQALHFPGVAIEDGSWVELDPRPGRRTVLRDSNPSQSLYGALERGSSAWWGLPPGSSSVRFRASDSGEGARMVLTWRNAYA